MYSKRYTHVVVGGERRTAFYYVLNPPYTVSAPSVFYYEIVAQGYKDWNLDYSLLQESLARAETADDLAEKRYAELERERKLSWKSNPNKSYKTNTAGTIDYLDFDSQLDKQWKAAMSRDMEDAFQSDYRRYAGW